MEPETSTDPDSPLTFHWQRARSRLGKLLLALVLVLAGLTVFFYVFRVAYPHTARFTPVPHQILALDVSKPEVAAIMNKVRDVDFMVLPEKSGQRENPSLQELAPVFHPSFEGHELKLQDLPHRPFVATSPRLLDANEPVLPDLDLRELKEKASPQVGGSRKDGAKSRLRMKLHGLPEDRLPRTLPHLGDVPVFDPAQCRFRIAVAADGRVVFALPIHAVDAEPAARWLTERVNRLRFAPLADAGSGSPTTPSQNPPGADQVQWGEVTFEWE